MLGAGQREIKKYTQKPFFKPPSRSLVQYDRLKPPDNGAIDWIKAAECGRHKRSFLLFRRDPLRLTTSRQLLPHGKSRLANAVMYDYGVRYPADGHGLDRPAEQYTEPR